MQLLLHSRDMLALVACLSTPLGLIATTTPTSPNTGNPWQRRTLTPLHPPPCRSWSAPSESSASFLWSRWFARAGSGRPQLQQYISTTMSYSHVRT